MQGYPQILGFDHVHIYVQDLPAAQQWYARVMGLQAVAALAVWAQGGGPFTIADKEESIHLALFQRERQACRSTVAFKVSAEALLAWQKQLTEQLPTPPQSIDHDLSWSLYFSDPDGNPYEITTYEMQQLRTLMSKGL